MQDLLTPKEVSQLLGISLATIYRNAKSGFLKSIKTPNGLRFTRESIARKIEGGLVGTRRANESK